MNRESIITTLHSVSDTELIEAFNQLEFDDKNIDLVPDFLVVNIVNQEIDTILKYQQNTSKVLSDYTYIYFGRTYADINVTDDIEDLFSLAEWDIFLKSGLEQKIKEINADY